MNQNEEVSQDLYAAPSRTVGPYSDSYMDSYTSMEMDLKAALKITELRVTEKEEKETKILNLVGTSSISFDKNTVYNTMKHNIGGQSKSYKTTVEDFPEWLNNTPRKTILMTQEAFEKIDWAAAHPFAEDTNKSLAKWNTTFSSEEAVVPVVAIAEITFKNRKMSSSVSSIVFILDVPGESFAISGELLNIIKRFDAFTHEPVAGPQFHITGIGEDNLWERNSFAFTDAKGNSYVFSRDNADFTVIL